MTQFSLAPCPPGWLVAGREGAIKENVMKITEPRLRASILLVRGGFTVSEAAKLLSLSVETVYLYVREYSSEYERAR
jgi:hypothetical protein